jgi:hypothetical protein
MLYNAKCSELRLAHLNSSIEICKACELDALLCLKHDAASSKGDLEAHALSLQMDDDLIAIVLSSSAQPSHSKLKDEDKN